MLLPKPSFIYFFPHEREKHANEFYTNTCCRKTHLSPVIWASGCHVTDLSISRCFKTLFVLLFSPPPLLFPRRLLMLSFHPFLFPTFPHRAPGVRPLRSEFILGPHQSHGRAAAASSASVSPSLPPPPPPSITSSR